MTENEDGGLKIMKQASLHSVICAFFLTGIILSIGSMASAQSGGFARRVASEPFSGRVVIVNRLKNTPSIGRRVGAVSVRTPINLAWQKARPFLIQLLTAFLNERNIGGGFRTSRNQLYLAENGSLFIGVDGQGFTLKYLLAGNSLTSSIRIPGPSPSGTDPRFNVRFDAELTIDVDRSGSGGIVAGPARLKLNVARPTGENLTGDFAVAANNLFNFVSGKDFIGEGVKAINSQEYALSKPVNLELDRMFAGLTSRKTIVTPTMRVNDSGALKGINELRLILEDDNGGPIVQ
jgi:hypothetical protein